MPLQKAPGIQVAVAESEPRPAVVRAELETLERAYTAESVNRRPGATRRARVSAWGRVKADVSTGAGKSEQKVASGEDVLNSFVKVSALIGCRALQCHNCPAESTTSWPKVAAAEMLSGSQELGSQEFA